MRDVGIAESRRQMIEKRREEIRKIEKEDLVWQWLFCLTSIGVGIVLGLFIKIALM